MHSNEFIRGIRRQHGMTITQFADFLGIPPYIVTQWEGEVYSPPLYVALLISRIFDLVDGAPPSGEIKDAEVK